MNIFESHIKNNPCKCSREYLSAVYLLSADNFLWKASRHAVGKRTIHFDLIVIKGISTYGYALYKLAENIYSGGRNLDIADLYDAYLIPDKLLELIFTVIRINRQGYSFIGIEKKYQ